jgi:hypothetical protein
MTLGGKLSLRSLKFLTATKKGEEIFKRLGHMDGMSYLFSKEAQLLSVALVGRS